MKHFIASVAPPTGAVTTSWLRQRAVPRWRETCSARGNGECPGKRYRLRCRLGGTCGKVVFLTPWDTTSADDVHSDHRESCCMIRQVPQRGIDINWIDLTNCFIVLPSTRARIELGGSLAGLVTSCWCCSARPRWRRRCLVLPGSFHSDRHRVTIGWPGSGCLLATL